MTQSTFINIHPNEYNQKFHYYSFTIKLYGCVGSCNTLDDLFNRVCVSKETEDLNISVFNMITRINGSKTLTKDILCKCKCIFDGTKCISSQKWNTDKC